jgi:rhodanese-related sulfurtransferase
MADAPRNTVSEVKKRIDAGEKFTFIDVRNPQAWAGSDTMLPGALRIAADNAEEKLAAIPRDKPVVAYCT